MISAEMNPCNEPLRLLISWDCYKNIILRLICSKLALYVQIWNWGKSYLLELYPVIDYIRNQIKKRRVEKRLTQGDVAVDLGITSGAYSKIESGPTTISVKKLGEIAAILEVDITYFFESYTSNKIEDANKSYGFATKSDIEELMFIIKKMQQEIAALKTGPQTPVPKKKKK